jgi:hypothetical protein
MYVSENKYTYVKEDMYIYMYNYIIVKIDVYVYICLYIYMYLNVNVIVYIYTHIITQPTPKFAKHTRSEQVDRDVNIPPPPKPPNTLKKANKVVLLPVA